MTKITELQREDLINEFFETMKSDPEYGFGDLPMIRDAAESTVSKWIAKNHIQVIDTPEQN